MSLLKNIIFSTLVAITLSSCKYHQKGCSNVFTIDSFGYTREVLNAAHIRPLCKSNSAIKEYYRFIWQRSFHEPIIVTLSKTKNISITAIRLNDDWTKRYQVKERKHVNISLLEFEYFKDIINKMDFMNQESDQYYSNKPDSGLEVIVHTDGASWILEGATYNNVNVIKHWSDNKGLFRKAALFLLEKSEITINGEIY
jgi:hypothetical protein